MSHYKKSIIAITTLPKLYKVSEKIINIEYKGFNSKLIIVFGNSQIPKINNKKNLKIIHYPSNREISKYIVFIQIAKFYNIKKALLVINGTCDFDISALSERYINSVDTEKNMWIIYANKILKEFKKNTKNKQIKI